MQTERVVGRVLSVFGLVALVALLLWALSKGKVVDAPPKPEAEQEEVVVPDPVEAPSAEFEPLSRSQVATPAFRVDVVSRDRGALEGAVVCADAEQERTNEVGAAEFGVVPGQVCVSHASHTPAVVMVDEPLRQAGGVRVVMEPGATLSGVVRSRQGEAIPGAKVVLRRGGMQSERVAASINADGVVCYQRSAVTDASGAYLFEGLAPGRHELVVSADGYVASGKESASETGELTLVGGDNQHTTTMLRLFAAAVGFQNEGPGPDQVLRTFGSFRMKYPDGLKDLPPGMSATMQRATERVSKLVGPYAITYVKIAREDVRYETPSTTTRLAARWVGLDTVHVDLTFVPLSEFGRQHAAVASVATTTGLGKVALRAPYPTTIMHSEEGKPSFHQRTVGPSSGELIVDVPEGSYRIEPAWDTFLARGGRVQYFKVLSGQITTLSGDPPRPFGVVSIEVLDAAGGPARDFSVRIVRASDDDQAIVDGSSGHQLTLYCELGDYKVQLRDAAFRVVATQDLTVKAGKNPVALRFGSSK